MVFEFGRQKSRRATINLKELKNDFCSKLSRNFDKKALLSFLLSFWDIFSDGALAYNFINGDYYEKTVGEKNDSWVTNFDCKKIGVCTTLGKYGKNDTTMFTYSCFEKDVTWGWIAVAIMLWTGIGNIHKLCTYKNSNVRKG